MLRRALKDGSLYVQYQPVVELATRRVVGAEALVRWRSRYADMRPDYFIPQAEQCDMIQLITGQVLGMVARDLPQFLKIDPCFRVAVNFSAADLCDNRTIDVMDQFLRVSGGRPQNIEIEATERAFLAGPETAEILDALRAATRAFRACNLSRSTRSKSIAPLLKPSIPTAPPARWCCTSSKWRTRCFWRWWPRAWRPNRRRSIS
jgi:sensor c-di-GMP phosphodiesterase-like protein